VTGFDVGAGGAERHLREEARMADEHPDRGQLERFLGDELTADERRAVVRHLLTGCPQCTAVTRDVWAQAGGPGLTGRPGKRARAAKISTSDPSTASVLHPASYRDLFERVAERGRRREREVAAERVEAPRLVARLLRAPAGMRPTLVQAEPRLATTAVVEILLERSAAEDLPRGAAPVASPIASPIVSNIELAELALATAQRLDPRRCGAAVGRDLLLRAWIRLGEARRRAGDLFGGERALAAAETVLGATAEAADDEGAAGERADLLLLAGSLAADRGHLHAADGLLERAVAAARRLETADGPRLLARALAAHGLALAAVGRPEDAVAALREATVEPHAAALDPLLLATALERQIDLGAGLGRSEEAARDLERLRSLSPRLRERPSAPRLRWLGGKVEAAADRTDEAEAAFLQARAGFLALGQGREAALVSLDLALLYLGHRRWSELRRLAGEIYPIFAARDMQREALMALLVFRRAAESESASVELLKELARYLAGFRARA
jgi:tetratricopeptide (TPR) repeat protein